MTGLFMFVNSVTTPPQSSGTTTASASSTFWTLARLGNDATGTMSELSSTSVNLTGAGTSEIFDDGTIAYLLSEGDQDIELICRIPETAGWQGTTYDFSFVGLELRDTISASTGTTILLATPKIDGRSRFKTKLSAGASWTTQATGLNVNAADHYLAINYNASSDQLRCWESKTGSADAYTQVGADISVALASTIYCCLFACAQNSVSASVSAHTTFTVPLTNATLSNTITITTAPPPGARAIRHDMSFESGDLQGATYQEAGVYVDSVFLQTLIPATATAITITNITSGSAPTATYTGQLTWTGSQAGTYVDGDPIGITFSSTGGFPEMQGRLIRVKNLNQSATGGTFRCYQDGDDTGYNPEQISDGDTATNSNGYSAWEGDTTANGWRCYPGGGPIPTANGGPYQLTVEAASSASPFTPPPNDINASASPVVPLRGDYFMSSQIRYFGDHRADFTDGRTNGFGNTGHNYPRIVMNIGGGSKKFVGGNDEWMSFSIFLPSNYHHENRNGITGRNQILYVQDSPNAGGDNAIELHIQHESTQSSGDCIYADIRNHGRDDANQVCKFLTDEDINKWTTFIINSKCHPTAGYLKLWKSVGPYVTGLQRNMEQRINLTNTDIGNSDINTEYYWNIRQYKFSWHNHANTISSKIFWIGWDEIRFGGVNEGTGFEDVHPFQLTEASATSL